MVIIMSINLMIVIILLDFFYRVKNKYKAIFAIIIGRVHSLERKSEMEENYGNLLIVIMKQEITKHYAFNA